MALEGEWFPWIRWVQKAKGVRGISWKAKQFLTLLSASMFFSQRCKTPQRTWSETSCFKDITCLQQRGVVGSRCVQRPQVTVREEGLDKLSKISTIFFAFFLLFWNLTFPYLLSICTLGSVATNYLFSSLIFMLINVFWWYLWGNIQFVSPKEF